MNLFVYWVVPEADGHCGGPPSLHNGAYVLSGAWEPWTAMGSPSSTSALRPVGTTMQAVCEPGFTLNCSNQCGKIKCDSDGAWVPLEGELISSCSAVPGGRVLGSVLNDSTSNGHSEFIIPTINSCAHTPRSSAHFLLSPTESHISPQIFFLESVCESV